VLAVPASPGPVYELIALPTHRNSAGLEKMDHRGPFRICTFLDQVTHNEIGNQVTMVWQRD
jgi:hypothetical protein